VDNELDTKGEEVTIITLFIRLNKLLDNPNSIIKLVLSESKVVVFY